MMDLDLCRPDIKSIVRQEARKQMINEECGMMNEKKEGTAFGFNSSFRIHHSSFLLRQWRKTGVPCRKGNARLRKLID
jgi:hypothetical protein